MSRFPVLLALLSALLFPGSSFAQSVEEESSVEIVDAADETTIRNILENEKNTDEVIREKAGELRKLAAAPRTPMQLALLLGDAARSGKFQEAGKYLDMRYLPEEFGDWPAADLAKALGIIWSQQNILDLSAISDQPEGHQNDELPSYRDLLGVIVKDDGESVPVFIQRIPDGEGGKLWKVSNATVARLPELWEDLGYGPIAVWLERRLPAYTFAGMASWQLIACALFVLVSWPMAGLLSRLLLFLALRVPNRFPLGIKRFFSVPLKLFIFVLVLRALMDQLALSLTTRVYLNSSGIDYIAFSILLLGGISLLRDYQIRRLESIGNLQYVALLKPFTTIVKLLVLLVIGLVWADRAGYNMSTILAGLGVGSLAVALAAQRTLENVIGAITLYTARPVNPGDVCRFGGIVGVVDEIGLRSTMIRTLNRTMLAVPNSVFASVEVENFSRRDRIRYFQQVELQMTSADQLRLILGRLRELFLSHADVLQATVSIRLEKIVAANAIIRIDAHVSTTDYQYFLAVAEDLNLRLIERVHNAGAAFSGPGQILQLRDFQQANEEQMATVTAQLEQWQHEERAPFPDYSEMEKAALKGSIALPPGRADS
ncbi:MAG: MscS family membrane protein [Halieaceae bacterium]|jgi:MscS family membrane protein